MTTTTIPCVLSLEATEPAAVVPCVDTHPTLAELGVPFFAFGFPPVIFDAPCNNLNGLAKLELSNFRHWKFCGINAAMQRSEPK
jgi:hypothetical protein